MQGKTYRYAITPSVYHQHLKFPELQKSKIIRSIQFGILVAFLLSCFGSVPTGPSNSPERQQYINEAAEDTQACQRIVKIWYIDN